MITKKSNRYYCDFCKKSGGAAGHMKKHELHCTMNPNRECGMCELIEQERSSYAEIIALLPKLVWVEDEFSPGCHIESIEDIDAVKNSLDMVREKTGDCPACIMAVYRQAGIPIPILTDFDYKQEIARFWYDHSDRQNGEI